MLLSLELPSDSLPTDCKYSGFIVRFLSRVIILTDILPKVGTRASPKIQPSLISHPHLHTNLPTGYQLYVLFLFTMIISLSPYPRFTLWTGPHLPPDQLFHQDLRSLLGKNLDPCQENRSLPADAGLLAPVHPSNLQFRRHLIKQSRMSSECKPVSLRSRCVIFICEVRFRSNSCHLDGLDVGSAPEPDR